MSDIEILRAPGTGGSANRLLDAKQEIGRGDGANEFTCKPDGFHLVFLANGGKGKSQFIAWFKPSAFEEVARLMVASSPKEAELAFLKAMLAARKQK